MISRLAGFAVVAAASVAPMGAHAHFPCVASGAVTRRATGALRRLMLLFTAVIIVGTGFTAYQLVQLEYSWAERVTVWGPIADLYRFLGFWPAVLFVPAIGLLGLIEMTRKLRATKAATSTVTKSE